MAKQVLVPLADGSEEIEAVTIIDVLRRADALVTVAAVDQLQITASRGVVMVADCLIETCVGRLYDMVALPGGMPGAANLRASVELQTILLRQHGLNKYYAAICAAPAVVLEPLGLLSRRRATCHPSYVAQLPDTTAAQERVVVDGPCVTSQGPGTALEFALTLVELLFGPERRRAIAEPMLAR